MSQKRVPYVIVRLYVIVRAYRVCNSKSIWREIFVMKNGHIFLDEDFSSYNPKTEPKPMNSKIWGQYTAPYCVQILPRLIWHVWSPVYLFMINKWKSNKRIFSVDFKINCVKVLNLYRWLKYTLNLYKVNKYMQKPSPSRGAFSLMNIINYTQTVLKIITGIWHKGGKICAI